MSDAAAPPPSPVYLLPRVVVYLLLNAVLNVGNKEVLAHFPFPVATIALGVVCSVLVGGAVLLWDGVPQPWAPGTRVHVACCVVGLCHGLGAAAHMLSLQHTSLALNQVRLARARWGLLLRPQQIIKMTSPVVTLLLSWLWLGRHFSWPLVAATGGIVAGSVLAVWTTTHVSHVGVASGVASCCIGAVEGVVAEYALRDHALSVTALQVYVGLWALAALAVPLHVWEAGAYAALAAAPPTLLVALSALSALAYGYVLFHYVVIHAAGAHFTNLIGSFKVAAVVAASVAVDPVYRASVTAANALGTALALAAFFAYSALKGRSS